MVRWTPGENGAGGKPLGKANVSLVRLIIRTKFALTSHRSAAATIAREREEYESLLRKLGPEKSRISVSVPSMQGIDADMRNWSLIQVIEHNTIVNQRFWLAVVSIRTGKDSNDGFDPKKDVMPSENPGEAVWSDFENSIERFQMLIARQKQHRGTDTMEHPLFGPLDVHGWHCMFGFHLYLHRRQGEAIAGQLLN